MTTQASALKKEELLGRFVHDGRGSFVIAAWYASPKKAAEIERTGCALVWPEWKWYWLEDLAVSGEGAAVLPALGIEQKKRIRNTLTAFLVPFGSDKWVMQQVGFKDRKSVRHIREAMGLPVWWERRTHKPEVEIAVVEAWLNRESLLNMSRRLGVPRNQCLDILEKFGRKRDEHQVAVGQARKTVIKNLKRVHGKRLKKRWR